MGGVANKSTTKELGCEKLFLEGHKLSTARDALRTPKCSARDALRTPKYHRNECVILFAVVDLLFDIHGTMMFPCVVWLFEFSKNRWFYNCK
jgi:hypothetical protein